MVELKTAEEMTRRFGLASPRSVTPLAGGVINRSFLLELRDGGVWVCRVDVEDRGGKLAREAQVYRWLWARAPGLPLVTAYHHDAARDLIPYEYALLPRLPGANLGADMEHLPTILHEPLLVQAGALLRRLHSLRDSEADLVAPDHASQSWREFVAAWCDEMVSRCQTRLGYEPAWAGRARDWMTEHSPLIPEAPDRVFLHGDYHFGNLQYAVQPDVHLSGGFDFEWAWSGHAHTDLLHLEEACARYPAFESPLLAGYGLAAWPSALPVYRLIHSISVLSAAIVESPEPLWDLIAWHGQVIDNVLRGAPPFRGLAPGRTGARISRFERP